LPIHHPFYSPGTSYLYRHLTNNSSNIDSNSAKTMTSTPTHLTRPLSRPLRRSGMLCIGLLCPFAQFACGPWRHVHIATTTVTAAATTTRTPGQETGDATRHTRYSSGEARSQLGPSVSPVVVTRLPLPSANLSVVIRSSGQRFVFSSPRSRPLSGWIEIRKHVGSCQLIVASRKHSQRSISS
jgi:hypothetical protein